MNITNDTELAAASAELDRLLQFPETEETEKRIEELSDAVWEYEEIHVQMPESEPHEMIGFMLDQHRMPVAKFAERLGMSEPLLETVATGEAAIDTTLAARLGEIFHISAAVFLEND